MPPRHSALDELLPYYHSHLYTCSVRCMPSMTRGFRPPIGQPWWEDELLLRSYLEMRKRVHAKVLRKSYSSRTQAACGERSEIFWSHPPRL